MKARRCIHATPMDFERQAVAPSFSPAHAQMNRERYSRAPLFQVMVEPQGHTPHQVAAVFRVPKRVALPRINHELGINVQLAKGMPELHGLRRRAPAVTLTYHDECGRLDVFNEVTGRAPGIDTR